MTPKQCLESLLDGQWHTVTPEETGNSSTESLRCSFRNVCEKSYQVAESRKSADGRSLMVRSVPIAEQVLSVTIKRKGQHRDRKKPEQPIEESPPPWSHEFMMIHSETYREVDAWLTRTRKLVQHGA